MSYKFSLDRLDRDSDVSLTQQIVDRVAAAIDAGGLAPGERLPTTRALAEGAGVNHLTASRAYRRLAELGYVTATVGRSLLDRATVRFSGDTWDGEVGGDRGTLTLLSARRVGPVAWVVRVRLAAADRLDGHPGALPSRTVTLQAGVPAISAASIMTPSQSAGPRSGMGGRMISVMRAPP